MSDDNKNKNNGNQWVEIKESEEFRNKVDLKFEKIINQPKPSESKPSSPKNEPSTTNQGNSNK
ncbi:hypothetical protein [Candidatus Deianiraea vastatrix]|uniref:Uncharacterized protein n=1 Tax=Candidatus Deianiraea vastatrix TaxID=2163644 RepID=A0A5B8XEC8_9RICK|nr:hypothetical protein [Candidatus Deianiraea vastatrix]QED23326.1 hypothetical protein Deia_00531 [Candidatus Deianiraea vastatrix]